MKEGGLSVPPQKKPELTEDRDSAYDDEDDDDDSDYTDSDDDRKPAPGGNLLE